MSNLYRQYLKLLEKWPIDELKSNDFGQYLRNEVRKAFPKGEHSIVKDKELCQRKYESLNRLASNYYADKYPCTFKTTSTGLTPEVCRLALSPEIQKLLSEQKLGRFHKIKESLRKQFEQLRIIKKRVKN